MKSYPHVCVIQGDSGSILPELLSSVEDTSIFWLDAHYSGAGTAKGPLETPLSAEIRAILGHAGQHIVLIDDARCFGGQNDYPPLSEIAQLVHESGARYSIRVADDIVRIVPTDISKATPYERL